MAGVGGISKAYVVLQAAQFASNTQIPLLRQLVARYNEVLKLDLLLRILLTYLPESTDPELYTDLLHDLVDGELQINGEATEDILSIQQEISENEARQRVRQLRLLPLAEPQHTYDASTDAFTLFLLHRAYRIDAETGSVPSVAQLVEPFLNHSVYLQTWAVSTLLPLLRLDYEYYPNDGPPYTLETFERLEGNTGVQVLLSKAAQRKSEGPNTDIGRDLRGLVGPWVCGQTANKRRKVEERARRRSSVGTQTSTDLDFSGFTIGGSNTWKDVNGWLLDLSAWDHTQAVEAIEQWDGPSDVDYGGWANQSNDANEESSKVLQTRYAQAALSMVYATSAATADTVTGSHRAICKVARILELRPPPELDKPDIAMLSDVPHDYIEALSPSYLLHNGLLRSENLLTSPTASAISLAYYLLATGHVLQSNGYPRATRSLLDQVAFGDEAAQLAELRKFLHTIQSNTGSSPSWESIRHQVLWLHDWSYDTQTARSAAKQRPCGLFWKVQPPTIENELLKAMLASSYYDLAVETYCNHESTPLPSEVVEKTVVDITLASYDGASNGNRTRGGVRKSSEIISAFRKCFPDSEALKQISALLTATHSMSFYSLTLQHGVPFLPVNIRAHKDPMSLVGKILEQNARSYTKLDDLLDIGQNLVAAGLASPSDESEQLSNKNDAPEDQIALARKRVTGMAIEAALRENDFDTAYSYAVNRLPPPPAFPNAPDTLCPPQDEISWRAAYHAGCYTPPKHSSSTSALRRLEQRMELLSQALLLAPPSNLPEILTVWRTCEEDLNTVFAREAAEEETWNSKGDRHIPGGFSRESVPTIQKSREPSRAAMNEEAPMGLFDVARGAASALSKNAFPLSPRFSEFSAGSLQSPHERSLSKMGSSGASESGSATEGSEGRVRKRDMVSNMVTGGLASGIGWVIGEYSACLYPVKRC